MTMPPGPGADGAAKPAARTACCAAAGTAGLLGSLACGASMVLAMAGAGTSAAVTGMAGMTGRGTEAHGGAAAGRPGVAHRLGAAGDGGLRVAPSRCRWWCPAGRAVLYAGMYGQSSPAVMYASIAVGYATWAGLYLWTRNRRTRRSAART